MAVPQVPVYPTPIPPLSPHSYLPSPPRTYGSLAGPAVVTAAGGTRFSQINLQHCIAASALLSRNLAVEQTDIALIQEPWILRGQVGGIDSSLGSLIHGGAEQGPRACVFVSRRLSALGLSWLCTRDLAAAKVSINIGGRRTELIVCSAYLPYDSAEPPPTAELANLVEYARVSGLSIIIGCDSNSHHTVWGSSDINRRGTAFLEYLSTTGLEILNKGSKPTFVTSRRQEVLDLTLGSEEVAQATRDWRVDEQDSLSDHRQIKFSIAGDEANQPEATYRNPRATDWATFKGRLGGRLSGERGRPRTVGGIEREVVFLQHALVQSFEEACPLKTRICKRKVAWWNLDLTKARVQSRKLLHRALRTNATGDWDSYKEAQQAYKRLIRRSKAATWRRFCEEIEALPTVARLRRVFASGPANRLEGLVLPDGRTTSSQEEVLAHLFEVHFPGSVLTDPERPAEGAALPARAGARDWATASRAVTPNRVRWAIGTFDRYKSPGTDGIFPALLQEAGEDLVIHLVRIFRACLALSYTPKAWREVRVVFIPKPGKDSYDRAKSFRPISLTSFLLKAMERLVDRFIRERALVERPVHRSQHAYQAGRSVETALHCTVKVIEGALHSGKSVLAVFIDIEGAFDNTSFESICGAAREFRIEESITNWIHHMLSTRMVTASLRGSEMRALVTRGCPQGGVTSPILWVLVIDELLADLERLGVTAVGYADDVAMLVTGDHRGEMAWRMQRALNRVEEWCTSKRLRVNPGKTEMVLFTRRRRLTMRPPSIFGTELHFSTEVRYLGVTLDSKLLWSKHLARQARKATATFWACRRMFSSTWGLSPAVVKWIHTAIIEPQLTYASLVWWPSLQKDSNRRTLDKVYRLALLGITGALRTTPTLAMGALLNIAPPSITAKGRAMSAALRLWFGGKWERARRGHASILTECRDLEEVLALGGDQGPCSYHFHRGYTISFPSRQEWEENRGNLLSPGGLIWFTDGSKTATGTGAGVWSAGPRTRISLALGNRATVLQAELLAISTCAEVIRRRGYTGKHIYICSDSRAALRSLASTEVRSVTTRDCIMALNRIASANRVKLLWVPGHSGIHGNEWADGLAKSGSAGSEEATPSSALVTPAFVKRLCRGWTEEQLTHLWHSSAGANHTKALFGGPSNKLGSELTGLSRKRLRWTVGLVTGHWFTRKHLRRLGWEVESLCSVCGEAEETPFHLIAECRGLVDTRRSVFGDPDFAVLRLEESGIGQLIRFAELAGLLPDPEF